MMAEQTSLSLVGSELSVTDMTALIKRLSNRRCDKRCNVCPDYSCPINPHYTGDKDDN